MEPKLSIMDLSNEGKSEMLAHTGDQIENHGEAIMNLVDNLRSINCTVVMPIGEDEDAEEVAVQLFDETADDFNSNIDFSKLDQDDVENGKITLEAIKNWKKELKFHIGMLRDALNTLDEFLNA